MPYYTRNYFDCDHPRNGLLVAPQRVAHLVGCCLGWCKRRKHNARNTDKSQQLDILYFVLRDDDLGPRLNAPLWLELEDLEGDVGIFIGRYHVSWIWYDDSAHAIVQSHHLLFLPLSNKLHATLWVIQNEAPSTSDLQEVLLPRCKHSSKMGWININSSLRARQRCMRSHIHVTADHALPSSEEEEK